MDTPSKFAAWLDRHEHRDPRYGHVYKYHPRSNAHSIAPCTFILEDLLERCRVLREQGAAGEVAYGINTAHVWPTGKRKTIDLAIGIHQTLQDKFGSRVTLGIKEATRFARVFVSCEAKTVMTEHKKSEPRLFDELGSSHESVHQGSPEAIAAGITVVNIAETFISPLRQTGAGEPYVSRHRQPDATESMVKHLRGLPIRDRVYGAGFDAYCTFVVDTDNVNYARLWSDPPAPQPGDRNHYETFITRISSFYAERFSVLP